MTTSNTDLAARLRAACADVRRKRFPIADLIPLLQQAADAVEGPPSMPAVLFDGYAVLKALDKKAATRTSAENVSDVLDAVVRLLGADAEESKAEPVAIPADVAQAAKSMRENDYRGPLAWARKVIDWVADYAAPTQPEKDERKPLSDEQTTQLAEAAGFNLTPTANLLYTVRGGHAQLLNFKRAVEAHHRIGSTEGGA